MVNLTLTNNELDQLFYKIFFKKYENIIFSNLFKVQTVLLNEYSELDDIGIRNALNELEQGTNSHGMKTDSQYRDDPLKGFWKKHYFSPDYINMNMKSELQNERTTTSKQINQLFIDNKGHKFTEIVNELSNLIVIGTIKNRNNENRLTGEWIIYANSNDKHYVLTLANHKEGKNRKETDQNIYNRIEKICFEEFPAISYLRKST
jgi:hypothetical protein